jgi:hypothetical protein
MNIPRFWASARQEADVAGRSLPLRIWGWSNESVSAAQAKARERLARVLERIRRGEELPKGYAYADRPVREEILREIPGADGETLAVVTRNRYGALVLNAKRALFLDVDVPRSGWISGLATRFFGRTDRVAAKLDRLRAALAGVPGASFRIYRTAAGYRVLATDPPLEVDSQRTRQLFETAGVDPHFVRLCAAQKCFRARLTPKPERCHLVRPPHVYPLETDAERQAFAEWLDDYAIACSRHNTCRFVESVGLGRVHEEIAPILAIHDAETKIDADLYLA